MSLRAHGPGLPAPIAIAILCCAGAACGDGDDKRAAVAGTAGASHAHLRPTQCALEDPTRREMNCSFLSVPESHAHPNAKRISLFVTRIPALAAHPDEDPILVLPGGPGASDHYDTLLLDHPMRAHRDVIILDQRGAGYSEPRLYCGELAEANFEAAAYGTDDPRATELARSATAACRARLVARGIDLEAYTTAESAEDVEDLRVALGVERLNLVGLSYGTRLALEVMRLHPHSVRSAMLGGTLPPQADFFAEHAANADKALNHVFDACGADCPISSDIRGEFFDTVDALDAEPTDVSVTLSTGDQGTMRFDGGTVAGFVLGSLYATQGVSSSLDPLVFLHERSFDSLADASLEALKAGDVSDTGLNLTVNCREEVAFTDLERNADVPRYLRGWSFALNPIDDECEVWDVGVASPRIREPVRANTPTLLLTGEFDPVTPSSWAELVAETLPNATAIELPGGGHDASLYFPCAQQLTADFFEDPNAPVDASCVDQLGPVEFVP